MAESTLLMGWKAIADYVGYSDRGLRNYRSMLLSGGVVFYRRQRLGKRIVCAWPDDLRAWAKAHQVASSGWQAMESAARPPAEYALAAAGDNAGKRGSGPQPCIPGKSVGRLIGPDMDGPLSRSL